MSSELYDIFASRPGRLNVVRKSVVRAGWQSGDCVLEIGFGNGDAAKCLAKEFGICVTGIDLDEACVCKACESVKHPLLKFLQADAANLPFEDRVFDGIYCEAAFSSVQDKSGAAAEFARVMKPGGILVVTDYERPEGAVTSGVLAPSLAGACTGDEYKQLFSAAGFALLQEHNERGNLMNIMFHLASEKSISLEELTCGVSGNVRFRYVSWIFRKR